METKTYDSLSTYLNLAKKTINKFAPKYISKEMLSSEEAISDIASAIMCADWKFDPDRFGKTGQKKTLYSYRNQCAIWAIKSYITNKYKKASNNEYSLDFVFNNKENAFIDYIYNKKSKDPLDQLIENEDQMNIIDLIDKLLSSNIVSEKQKDQLRMYYIENKTLANIGSKYNVSREAIRQSLKRAIENIQTYS